MVCAHANTTIKHHVFETPRPHVGYPRFFALLRGKKHSPSPGGNWLAGWVGGWLVGWLGWLGWLAGWLGWPDGWLAADWLLVGCWYGKLVSI